MKLSIVIPAYNEERNLPLALARVATVLDTSELAYEVIVVDDGSVDGSWPLLQQRVLLDQWRERLRGVRFSRNFGKEAAILAGLRHADGDAVVVMDADLQHPPEMIRAMVDLWLGGRYNVVEAVKRQRQRESVLRRISARFFYRFLMFGADLDLRGSTDFKLLDRGAVDVYLEMPETGRFFRGLTSWIGLSTARVEFEVPERTEGTTRWRLGGLFKLARSTIVSFTSLPLHLISWIGVGGLILSIVLTIQTLLRTWIGASEAGFPTVIFLILFMGSLILISLGIIGEYLAELYNEVKRRPVFVVRETLGSDASSRKHSSIAD
jgi:glycosyltransferase involved in cell wall biosynthesis